MKGEPKAWLATYSNKTIEIAQDRGEFDPDHEETWGAVEFTPLYSPQQFIQPKALDHLADGLENLIDNAKRRHDDYDVGYIGAMLKMLNELRHPDAQGRKE